MKGGKHGQVWTTLDMLVYSAGQASIGATRAEHQLFAPSRRGADSIIKSHWSEDMCEPPCTYFERLSGSARGMGGMYMRVQRYIMEHER